MTAEAPTSAETALFQPSKQVLIPGWRWGNRYAAVGMGVLMTLAEISALGKRRVSRPIRSVAQIMDWTWKVGQQFAVIPTSLLELVHCIAVLKWLRGNGKHTFTSSVILLRYRSLQHDSAQYGMNGPRMEAFNIMNFLYFLYKSFLVRISA